jgi:hypothetical protein
MKKLLLALGLGLGLCHTTFAQGPPTGPPYVFTCNQNIASNFTVVATSTAVAGVIGKGTYICGWHASTANTSTAATTFQLTYTNATTTNTCLSSTPSAAMTPFNAVTSTAPSVDHPGTGMLNAPQVTPTSSPSSVCLNVGGTASLQFILYYGQY